MPSQPRLAMDPLATLSAIQCQMSEASVGHLFMLASPRNAMSTSCPFRSEKRTLRSTQARWSHVELASLPLCKELREYVLQAPLSSTSMPLASASSGTKPMPVKSLSTRAASS
eukprot:scaffold105352_cov45-Prasinocladus_malaysianus.AAC.1